MTVPQGDTVATGVQGPLVPITKAILSVSSLLFLLLITPTSAQQPAAPLPAILFSSIASTNNTLYIRGGNIQAQQVAQQFYSLNLTPLLNYSGNNITWTKRNAGPLIDFRTVLPLAVDNDNQELISFGDLGTLARYTVVTNTWSKEVPICKTPFNANTASLSIANFQPALTDPRTGLIYIPYGYDMGKSMLVFNTVSNACSGIPMPIGSNGQLYAWSESRNAIYMLGNTAPPARIALWQFDLAIREWNIFVSFMLYPQGYRYPQFGAFLSNKLSLLALMHVILPSSRLFRKSILNSSWMNAWLQVTVCSPSITCIFVTKNIVKLTRTFPLMRDMYSIWWPEIDHLWWNHGRRN